MKSEEKHTDEKKINLSKYIIDTIFALIVVLATGFINKLTDKIFEEPSTENIQKFINHETQVEYVGIQYVKCELSASPDLHGYQVKPYPYIVCRTSEEQIYIPVCEQFTQLQYTADQAGDCQLLKEDLTSEFNTLFEDVFGDTEIESDVGCLVVIRYTSKANKSITEVYELQSGQLIYADKDVFTNVINTISDEKGFKIKVEDLNSATAVLEQVKQKLL